jgi:hypothetical protein
MGCRPARPGERHLATRRACSMRHKLERRAVVARSASVGAGPRRLLRLGPSLKPRYLRRRGFFCGGHAERALCRLVTRSALRSPPPLRR